MDRNTIAGLVVVGLIVVGFSLYSSNQSKKYQREKFVADSIAEANRVDPVAEQVEPFDAGETIAGQVAGKQETLSHTADSIRRVRMGDALVNAETGEEQFQTFSNDVMEITFCSKGAHVAQVTLKDYRKYGEEEPLTMYTPGSSYFNLGLYLMGNHYVNTGDFYFQYAGAEDIQLPEGKSAQRILYNLPVDSVSYIQYAYTIFSDDYMVDFDVNFVNMQHILSSQMPSLMLSWGNTVPQQEKGFDNENKYSTIAYKAPGEDKVRDIGFQGSQSTSIQGNVQWIALKQQFFTTAFIARNNFQRADFGFDTFEPMDENLKKYHAEANVAFDRNKSEYGFQFYFGPIKYSQLKKYDMNMERLVNLGWSIVRWVNTGLVIPVFNFLTKHIGSIGLIIFLLTLMIKIIILPLTYKSYLSMGKMRLLKPELDEIAAKFPKQEDAMKKQQATMELYKRAGVSPMGGCLPMLIQMPVIMALFFFFPTAIELRGQSFLWAEDLSTYDSILNLPFSIPWYGDHVSLFTLLMAASLFLNTKLNQTTTPTGAGAGSMKVMMYIMPLMLLIWFNNYASGLCYYYLLSNLITIGQTYGMKFVVNDEKLHARMKSNAAKTQTQAKKNKGKSKWQIRLEEAQRQQQQAMKQQQKKRR